MASLTLCTRALASVDFSLDDVLPYHGSDLQGYREKAGHCVGISVWWLSIIVSGEMKKEKLMSQKPRRLYDVEGEVTKKGYDERTTLPLRK
jgi:hypothetical protein